MTAPHKSPGAGREPVLVNVEGFFCALQSGSEITLGWNADDASDESYWFKFSNKEGEVGRLRLSKAAFESVIAMKADVDLHRNTKSVQAWRYVVKVQGEDSLVEENIMTGNRHPGSPDAGPDAHAMAQRRLHDAAPDLVNAALLALSALKNSDHGDPTHETGWESDESCAAYCALWKALEKAGIDPRTTNPERAS